MLIQSENNRYRELADFLKTRRAKISPSQVGLSSATRRRTPGLRREEVAQLAGIGLTWYTWLEQGRPIQVSTQVIESLARVLLLDKQELLHLYLLANLPLPADNLAGHQETVSPALQHVLDSLEFSPSMIMDQRWNVIAWNNAASLVFGDFHNMNERERNLLWGMFTEDRYKQLLVDWDLHAKSLLARFRSVCGQFIEDVWFAQLINDLKIQSKEFNSWWPLHEVERKSEVYKQLKHPKVGMLEFEVSKFDISDNSGLTLTIHTSAQGTDTADKMKSLCLS